VFETKCPKCGKKQLTVIYAEAQNFMASPLDEDGFNICDFVKTMDTDSERVKCNNCGWEGPLYTLMKED
jgi:ribosomal protein S27E